MEYVIFTSRFHFGSGPPKNDLYITQPKYKRGTGQVNQGYWKIIVLKVNQDYWINIGVHDMLTSYIYND